MTRSRSTLSTSAFCTRSPTITVEDFWLLRSRTEPIDQLGSVLTSVPSSLTRSEVRTGSALMSGFWASSSASATGSGRPVSCASFARSSAAEASAWLTRVAPRPVGAEGAGAMAASKKRLTVFAASRATSATKQRLTAQKYFRMTSSMRGGPRRGQVAYSKPGASREAPQDREVARRIPGARATARPVGGGCDKMSLRGPRPRGGTSPLAWALSPPHQGDACGAAQGGAARPCSAPRTRGTPAEPRRGARHVHAQPSPGSSSSRRGTSRSSFR